MGDLSTIDLSAGDLSSTDLSSTDLSSTDLSAGDLSSTDLSVTDLLPGTLGVLPKTNTLIAYSFFLVNGIFTNTLPPGATPLVVAQTLSFELYPSALPTKQ